VRIVQDDLDVILELVLGFFVGITLLLVTWSASSRPPIALNQRKSSTGDYGRPGYA
jgi:hypothetical protein